MKKRNFIFIFFSLILFSVGCTSPQGGCPDFYNPPGIDVDPIDGNNYVTISRTRQWRASVNGIVLPASEVVWTTSRGDITPQGLLTAPETPTHYQEDWVKVQRTNPNSYPKSGVNYSYGIFFAILCPIIQSFTSPTPMPVASGANVQLAYQFSDGAASLYQGANLVQSGLVSGGNLTVKPASSTVYILKVTNMAGDSVTQDLAVTVQ